MIEFFCFKVKVWEHYQSIRNASIYYVDGSKYKLVIDNLYKNRNYKLRVQAWSLGGEGKYSSPEKEFRFDNDGRLLIRKFLVLRLNFHF